MKKRLLAIAAASGLLVAALSAPAFAGRAEFCEGFKEGFKTVKGDRALVPRCPLKPLTPLGSTDYREGLKAGMKTANE